MRGFDDQPQLEAGQFFLCTEVNEVQLDDTLRMTTSSTTPASIQQSNNNNTNANSNRVASSISQQTTSSAEDDFASIPVLPWWFTAEVRRQLLNIAAPISHFSECYEALAATPERPPSSVSGGEHLTSEEYLKAKLKRQLEYYFSRENLINDRYLRSQMDSDQYVAIKIIASFPKVAQLSNDFDLIVEVLKSSSQLQVDERGEKVRAVTKRCTIILRGISENADEEEVKAMFDGCPAYQSLTYGLNDSWYVTFVTEEDTRRAFVHLQNLGKSFNGKPVYARIKSGGAPIGADVHPEHKYSPELRGHITIHQHETTNSGGGSARPSSSDTNCGQSPSQANNISLTNLGQILSQYGYVPRATFRPSMPMASIIPLITMSHAGSAFGHQLQPSPTSFFAQPIIGSVNGYCNYVENCSGGEQSDKRSGSSRFETSSNSTVATIPRIKQRITDVPRIDNCNNRNNRGRSPIFFNNTGQLNKSGGGFHQPMSRRYNKVVHHQVTFEDNFAIDDFAENMIVVSGNTEEQQQRYRYAFHNNNSSNNIGKLSKQFYRRQQQSSFDGVISAGIGKPVRFSSSKFSSADRSAFRERRGPGQLRPLNNWRLVGCTTQSNQSMNNNGSNRMSHYGGEARKGSYRSGGYGGPHSSSTNTYGHHHPVPLSETQAPSPVSWRQQAPSSNSNKNVTSAGGSGGGVSSVCGLKNTPFARVEDNKLASTTSTTTTNRQHSNQQQPPQQNVPVLQPLINIQKPAPLSSQTNKPNGNSTARPISLLNGHKSSLETATSTVALKRCTTGPSSYSSSGGSVRAEKHSILRRHKKEPDGDRRNGTEEQQRPCSRSDFNFVEKEFPTLDHQKCAIPDDVASVEVGDANHNNAERYEGEGVKWKSPNRAQFSAIVAGRRRASSSDMESAVPSKQNYAPADAKISYAQTLKAITQPTIQIQRRESTSVNSNVS